MSTEPSTINRDVQRSRDMLVADLKRIVGDADGLLSQLANSTSEELASTRRKIEVKLKEARARVDEARIATARKVCDAADATNEYISKNPWKVVGVVSLVGVLAALFLQRRSRR